VSTTDGLIRNNQEYAASFSSGHLPMPPGAQVAVVACMDARLSVYGILGLREGDAHVIRNAGGVVTDDVIRSLTISQRLLGTREVILIHHTDCGMLTFKDDEVKADIEAETGLRPPFAWRRSPTSIRTCASRSSGSRRAPSSPARTACAASCSTSAPARCAR
jgi:carbonic anhydrase